MDYSTITIVMFKNVKEKKKDVKYQLDAFYREQETIESESESEVAQSCPTLCDPMDCSLSVSSVHGIFQARVLEWIAISFSRESSQRRNRTQVSCIAGRRFTVWATREVSKQQIWIWKKNQVQFYCEFKYCGFILNKNI